MIPPTYGRKNQRKPSPLPPSTPRSSLGFQTGALRDEHVPGVTIWGKTVSSTPTHILSPNMHLGCWVYRELRLPSDWKGQRLRRCYCQAVVEKDDRSSHTSSPVAQLSLWQDWVSVPRPHCGLQGFFSRARPAFCALFP